MSRRQRQALAKRYARALLTQERAYYREIRRLYRAWLNRLLEKLSRAINSNVRLDSDPEIPDGVSAWGFLSPLFNEAVNEWKVEVQRFVIPMKSTAKKIAELSKMIWTKQRPVNLQVSPLMSEPWLETQLQDFAAENASLITKIGQDTADRIQAATVDSLKRGTGRKALQDEVRKIDHTIGETRAKTLARDQMGKLQANLTEVRAERVGVKQYEWQTVGDNRVRPKHQALDGDIRTFGEGLEPGFEINCRCVAIPQID